MRDPPLLVPSGLAAQQPVTVDVDGDGKRQEEHVFASISSAVLFGAEGHAVTVEVYVGDGLPGFHIVGLPDATVREARDRVRAAVVAAGVQFPESKVIVNLAPSQQRKSGSGLDLAIAVGVLVADGHIPSESLRGLAFLGELGLDGSLRAIAGVAPMAGVLGDLDLVVPVASAPEAEVAARGRVRPVAHLAELRATLEHDAPWPDHDPPPAVVLAASEPDMSEVRGQPMARRALELAAAGGHHLLFVGPPGAGKTMLASRLPGLLPDLEIDQALETTMVHSAAGVALPPSGLVTRPPFRAPHHTSSQISIIGGGSHSLRPGEISIATGGVLFLDELPEFAPSVIETLRQPLEDGSVHVARAAVSAVMPAHFQLVAAMNPCPCGGGAPGSCECGEARTAKYLQRVSGALLDRFDLRVRVTRPAVDDLLSTEVGESTAAIAERVAAARRRSIDRQGCLNAQLPPRLLDEMAPLDDAARQLLRDEVESDRLSGRGYHRVRRVARTIADLSAHLPTDPSADPSAYTGEAAGGVIGEATLALALGMRMSLRSDRERRSVA
ncbi:MAG: YifB family Mg chelatase-like AAA ATPase [Ilumatobacter sp.]|uniref:YifB family Mg chelatase-like AAA ATPase n=1 Tax=Ilumatobacter sp. TaxID=1967498 RepID=UPI003918D2EA